jgi:ParB/RepB/Spo0J family partition protein
VFPHELPVTSLDERYGMLRIVQPGAERAVRESVRRLGQLMPIVVCERDDAFAIVDGFKRVAAARALGIATLRTRVMPLNEPAALAAIVSLNRPGRGLTDLEEALVVRALCRDQRLEQVQVAELLGRHKSWVCRRLALAERLTEAVACDVRAGLVTSTVAREVARLPRGNQPDVAAAIRREGLGSHDAARLVTLFTKTSGAAQQRYLLEHPREALEANGPRTPFVSHDPRLGPLTQDMRRRLFATMSSMSALALHLDGCMPMGWTQTEREVLGAVLAKTRGAAELLLGKLADAHAAVDAGHASA